jgi:hypothetical protein
MRGARSGGRGAGSGGRLAVGVGDLAQAGQGLAELGGGLVAEVRGPISAILLLLTGRQAGLAQLSGPGVLELETRAWPSSWPVRGRATRTFGINSGP